MTLLSIIRDHCQVHALNMPTTVVGSQDTTIKQLWGLMNSLLEEVIDESKWQAFSTEKVWTLVAGEDQGDLDEDICSGLGFLWAYNGTFYDRSQRRPLYGPCSDVEWQQLKAIPNPGPWYKYRIKNNHLLINPAPTVGSLSQIAFEFATKFGVKGNDGTPKDSFTADDDVSVLPERILKKGLAYRWKELKGLPSQNEEDRYFKMLNNFIARDKTARTYDLAEPYEPMMKPGIFVPSGNWPV